MCELLGISSNRAVRPNILFKGFKHRGEQNPHGWGLALYPDKGVQIFKEPLKGNESQLANFLANYNGIGSKHFIAHVRKISSEAISYRNTHPFDRELNGKSYVFAHNGTLYNYRKLDVGRFRPIGETDSEYLFCHLLTWMDDNEFNASDCNKLDDLRDHLQVINQLRDNDRRNSKLNCLLSDGETLICYSDLYINNGLHWLNRPQGYFYEGQMLSDEDYDISFRVEKGEDQNVHIIATKKMTKEFGWQNFMRGELRVYENGKLIFSDTPFQDVEISDVEVYQAPDWLISRNSEENMKIGLPKSLREQLDVNIGDTILVESATHSTYLKVCKTDRRLLNGHSTALTPTKHAVIPKSVRDNLNLGINLTLSNNRENSPHFKQVFHNITISKI